MELIIEVQCTSTLCYYSLVCIVLKPISFLGLDSGNESDQFSCKRRVLLDNTVMYCYRTCALLMYTYSDSRTQVVCFVQHCSRQSYKPFTLKDMSFQLMSC